MVCRVNRASLLSAVPSLKHSVSSNSFLGRDYGNSAFLMPSLNKRVGSRSSVISSASKSFCPTDPKMTERPKWWWRAVAYFPYLLPLYKLWLHADSVYYLHKLLEDWEFLVIPFIDTLMTMPSWFLIAITFCLYYFVVKKKECPHFLRFHLVMAMLLESVCDAMEISCRWLSKTFFRGNLGMHFWLAVSLAQLYTVAECMRCALAGKYADTPFVSDAAYLHTDLNMFPS